MVSAGAVNAAALEVPRLNAHVNDYAAMLSTASERQLEAVLTEFEQNESTQIVVLTIPSLQGDSIEDFSIRVAEAWKIGQKKLDNGAILLIAKNDRKIRIDVGYGLEGRLTDLLAGRIIRDVIAPQFKSGQFDQGITEGVAAMIDAVRGEYSVADAPRQPRPSQKGVPVIALLALFFLINALGRAGRWIGATAGAVLFPIAGALFFGLGPLLLLGLVPLGLVAGLLISLIGGALPAGTATSRHRGGYWGGGSGGGGFSSGGFGGFSGGGGGFGGGGASGGW
ncbi:MAG: TPM domain-containing protein [Deltaproteobacteria bacterium]|nr:TPM domain-containing protein [Deltaproteobacteria bacterium]